MDTFSENARWSSDHKRLLRAKALSALHETPHCPIVTPLVKRVIKLTCGIDPIFDSDWYTQHLLRHGLRDSDGSIGDRTRYLVQEMYGISIDEQLRFEREIAEWEIGPLPAVALSIVSKHPGFLDMADYGKNYVRVGRC